MDAVTAGHHWSRCRHCLRLQLPLPLSLILFSSSHSQWICNDRAGFWIRDGGRQVFKTAQRGGSASNAGWAAGFNVTHWVCLYSYAGSWCVMNACNLRGGRSVTTAYTRRGSWHNYWPSLCSGPGRSHALSDISNARIVQRKWGGGVLTLDCRGYGTPSWRGIPLASQCGNASLSWRKLWIPWRPSLVLILMISKTSNNSYNGSCVRVRALGRHIPI